MGNQLFYKYRFTDDTNEPFAGLAADFHSGVVSGVEIKPDIRYISNPNYYSGVALRNLSSTDRGPLYNTIFYEHQFDRFLESIQSITLYPLGTPARVGLVILYGPYRLSSITNALPYYEPAYDPTNAYDYRFTINIEVPPGAHVYGWEIAYTERDRIQELTTPTGPVPGIPPFPDIFGPAYNNDGTTARASSNARVLRRHPQMPYGLPGPAKAVEAATGTQVDLYTYGDYVVFGTGSPPYTLTFNKHYDHSGLDQFPPVLVPTADAALFEARRQLDTDIVPAWSGLETYRTDRNLVRPRYTVRVDGSDMSPYLSEFSPDRVVLTGPSTNYDVDGDGYGIIEVLSDNQPVYAGRVIRADSEPSSNIRKITFSLLPHTRYYDVDLSEVDMAAQSMPVNEEEYIDKLARAAGYGGDLYTPPGVKFRSMDFWTAAVPHGPGMTPEEIQSRYWNPSGGTTFQDIATIAQANLLDVYDLPDGQIGLFPLMPYQHLTLFQIYEQGLTVDYNVDADNNYVNDTRLSIGQVSLAYDETFSKIEVEGFSNIVKLDLKKTPAPFVMNNTQYPHYEKTMGMWTGNLGFEAPFQKYEDGAVQWFVPKAWMAQLEVNPHIKHERLEKWGWFGHISVVGTEIRSSRLYDRYPNTATGRLEAEQKAGQLGFYKSDGTTGDADIEVYYGFWAMIEGWNTAAGTFRFAVDSVEPDTQRLRIDPLIGRFRSLFLPLWFPEGEALISIAHESKPRKAKRVQNQYVTQISSQYSVQTEDEAFINVTPNTHIPEEHDAYYRMLSARAEYSKDPTAYASKLATCLTLQAYLDTRSVELSYAGAHTWYPGQFVTIAQRPATGPGTPVTFVHVLMTRDTARTDARVGSEAWTRVKCAYVGNINLETGEVKYVMPLGWNPQLEV